MLSKNGLASLMRQYHAAKVAADKAKAISETLKAEAKERGVGTLEAGGFIATVKDVTSNTFDAKRFKADYPDLYAKYCKSSTTTRLYFK